MKRIIVILLVLVFALSFTACGESYTLEGKWKAGAAVVGEVTDSDESYVILEFKNDGTGLITNFSLDVGHTNNFTYSLNENALTVSTESGEHIDCTYEIEGDTLIISTGYKTSVYTRVK